MLENPKNKYYRHMPFSLPDRTWPDVTLETPPIWCSVDLRDGNQALIEPMDIERKIRMFEMLLKIGFKEIEVGFPSASQLDFDFVRKIIEEDRIPDDVTIQVLTPAREPLIERTFAALKGAKRAIVHYYNATAPVMRKVVFGFDQDGARELAVSHARLIKKLADEQHDTAWRFQYSPEMFSSTEIEFAKTVCDEVTAVFSPTPEQPLIINLPSTVECMSPNVFADQIEWMHRHLKQRDTIVLSVHAHNDRGTGTASAELALMAGADRLEGCLFGNGERTGNLDIINVALNMYVHGVHPGLDFSDINGVRKTVEHCNRLPVPERHPYAGDLVFTSFSGSHQDAIRKAFASRNPGDLWDMPYLLIDPKDIGRNYEAVIRVNSQSGKGGVTYLLEAEYGLKLPRALQVEFSQVVQKQTESRNGEMTSEAIWQLFEQEYLEPNASTNYDDYQLLPSDTPERQVELLVNYQVDGHRVSAQGSGSGPIDALIHAINASFEGSLDIAAYNEHAIGEGADAKAACYIALSLNGAEPIYGVGINSDIVAASVQAIFSGFARAMVRESRKVTEDCERVA